MFKIFLNRYVHILIIILAVLLLLAGFLHNLTIDEYLKYSELSLQWRIRKMEIPASRGEITDIKGNVLAKNAVGYSIKLNSSMIPTDEFSEQCIRMYDFFESRGEKQQEFPIYIEDGIYKYRFDENIRQWLVKSGYEDDWSARDVFEYEKSAYYIDKELSDYEAMKLLLSRSIYLPISTIGMKFTEQIAKEQFLQSYGIDIDTPPKQAFEEIRSLRSFRISEELAPEEAYKIMVYRHLVREKGDLKYEPIEVAPQVSLETAVLVAERAHEFPGLYSDFTVRREYSGGDLASHIVGYIGKIATENEIEYFVDGKGYNRYDSVGKTGIEYVMDDVLHGRTGFKYIEADVNGKYIGEVNAEDYGLTTEKQSKGSNIQLTIDIELQQKLKNTIIEFLGNLQTGNLVKSKWGDYSMKKYATAETAAVAIADVKTGKIYGAYSYPSYDSMVFMDGITKEDWDLLNPSNSRNPIAARPLLDLTAMMAVQPGSTYKMITGYAALTQGLDPHQQIFADGFIEIGQHTFGCWLWNQHHAKHGLLNLRSALKESCNYYFFCIANATDYYNKRPLDFEMNNDILINTSKLFGMGESSGAEVPELIFPVPDVERKVDTTLALLRYKLEDLLPEYFAQGDIDTAAKREKIIETIVGWAQENPSRGDIIERLFELGSNPDYLVTEKLADIIKYDHFNMMEWYEGDTMNLSIGQGEHAYTPLQMLRYTSIIANGGVPIELTYINSIGGVPYYKNQGKQSFDTAGNLIHIQEGMYKVVNDPGTFIYNIYKNFPIKIAGKTGTAEKEGKIPPLDEVEYLLNNLRQIAPELTAEQVEEETVRIIKERSEEMSRVEAQIDELEAAGGDEELLHELHHKFADILNLDRLNKGDAMREAIKNLTEGRVTDDDINRFRPQYESFSWFVCYAPYDNPEIAVSVLVPQGGEGHNAAVLARDVIAAYYGLDKDEETEQQDSENAE